MKTWKLIILFIVFIIFAFFYYLPNLYYTANVELYNKKPVVDKWTCQQEKDEKFEKEYKYLIQNIHPEESDLREFDIEHFDDLLIKCSNAYLLFTNKEQGEFKSFKFIKKWKIADSWR